jgi:2-dehydro-3-deoxyglucarate aldolase/4-hydroxy-2-oxoheptanedioate aldolase
MMNLKERLKAGQSILGTMVTVFDNPEIANILKVCGFDFFIVDCEHGNFDYSDVAKMCTVAREAGIPSMVRIPEVRREVVLKFMELGARGLLLPNTETVSQAKALVAHSKYYPMGNRGVSLLCPHTGFKKIVSAAEYMKKANEENILMVQIESPTAVENINNLLDVEGIDAAFVGPNDLSQSMGILGQMDNPQFIAAIDKVIAAAKRRGKFSGIHMMSVEALHPWIEKGMNLNFWANDVIMMMNAAKAGLAQLKRARQKQGKNGRFRTQRDHPPMVTTITAA